MIFNTSIWLVPASTKAEHIEGEFRRVFNGFERLPKGGVMPMSVKHGGANIVSCMLPYDLATAKELVKNKGQNWQVFGWQTFNGDVEVPVKEAVVRLYCRDGDISHLHKFSGQADWSII